MGTSEIFGQRLTQLREEYNMNRSDVAKILNKTRSMVSYYETGGRLPSFDVLVAIADHFGVSLDWLMGKSDIRDVGHRKDQIPLGRTVKIPIILQTAQPGAKLSSPDNTIGYIDVPFSLIDDGEYICINVNNEESANYALIKLTDYVNDGELAAIHVGGEIKLFRLFKANDSFVLCDANQDCPEILKRGEFKVIGKVKLTATLHTETDEQSIQV